MHDGENRGKGNRGRVATATQRTTGRLSAAHGLQDQVGQCTPSPAEIVAPAAGARRAHGSLEASVDRILTVAEVAALLRVPKSWVYEHVRPGANPRLPHFKLGKYVRFRQSNIETFLADSIENSLAGRRTYG